MMRFKGFTYILSCLLVLASCGCTKPHVQPSDTPDTPSTPVTPDPPGFQRYITDLQFPSNTLREHVTYSIYLPADYDTDTETRYSVVYMLHGLGDNNNSWNGNYLHANSKINSWEARGLSKMIYVFPKGFSSYFCNFYNGSYNYMDMFINELIPEIDAKYRTIPDREHRAITGYSMGGFGACALAEKHPPAGTGACNYGDSRLQGRKIDDGAAGVLPSGGLCKKNGDLPARVSSDGRPFQ